MSPLTFLLLLGLVCGSFAINVFPNDDVVQVDASSAGVISIKMKSGTPLSFVDIVQFSATQVDFKKSTWLNTGVLGSLKDGNLDVTGTPITVTATTGNISFTATDATKKAGLWSNNVESLVASSSGMTVPIAIVDSVSWTTGDLTLASTAGSVQFYSQSATNKVSLSLKGAAVLNVTKEQLEFQNAFTWAPAGAISAKPTVATKAFEAKNGTTTMTINNTEIKFSSTPSAAGVGDSLTSATAATVLALKGATGVELNAVNATGAVNLTTTAATGKVTADKITGEEDLILAAGATKAVLLAIGTTNLATIEKAKLTLENTITNISGEGDLTVQSGATGDLKFTGATQVNLSGAGAVLAELKATSSDFKLTKFTMAGTNAMDIKGKVTVTQGGVYKGGIAMGAGKVITSTVPLTIGSGGDLAISGTTVTLLANAVEIAKVEAAGFTVQAALPTTFSKTSTFKGATTVTGVVTLAAGAVVTSTGAQTLSNAADKLSFDGTAVNVNGGAVVPFTLATNQLTFGQNVVLPATGFVTFGASTSGLNLNTSGAIAFGGTIITSPAATDLAVKALTTNALNLDGTSIDFKVGNASSLTLTAAAVTSNAKLLDLSLVAATSTILDTISLADKTIVAVTGGAYTFETTGSGETILGSLGTGKTSLTVDNAPIVECTSTLVSLVTGTFSAAASTTNKLTITGDLVSTGVITTGTGGISASKFVSSATADLNIIGKPTSTNLMTASTEIKLESGANNTSFKASSTTVTGPLKATAVANTNNIAFASTLTANGDATINLAATDGITVTQKVTFSQDTVISTAAAFPITIGVEAKATTATVQANGKLEFKTGTGATALQFTVNGAADATGVTGGVSLLFATNKGIITAVGHFPLLGILYGEVATQTVTVPDSRRSTAMPAVAGTDASIVAITSPSLSGMNVSSGCFCSFVAPSNAATACACRVNSTTLQSFAIGFNQASFALTTGGANFVVIVGGLALTA